jgi:hypothetical protein
MSWVEFWRLSSFLELLGDIPIGLGPRLSFGWSKAFINNDLRTIGKGNGGGEARDCRNGSRQVFEE